MRPFWIGTKIQMPPVNHSFAGATKNPEEKGVMTFYHPPRAHDDQLLAFALAVYAAKDRGTEPS
jgi:hypothetical protein